MSWTPRDLGESDAMVSSICEASQRSSPEIMACLHLAPFLVVPTQVKHGLSGYVSRTARGSQRKAMAIGDVMVLKWVGE
jgi:hypothetical protein